MSWMNFNKSFKEFVKAGRNEPGVLVEILDSGRRRVLLIGDINASASAEAGGRPFSDEAIVCRYQYIWGSPIPVKI